jgi:hypothetical protein
LRALHNSYFHKEGGLFLSSKALGLVFSATYLWGSFAHLPASGGISPIDKLLKRQRPYASHFRKSHPLSWVTKIVRLCKDLTLCSGRPSLSFIK